MTAPRTLRVHSPEGSPGPTLGAARRWTGDMTAPRTLRVHSPEGKPGPTLGAARRWAGPR
jgi:hypothetical protein